MYVTAERPGLTIKEMRSEVMKKLKFGDTLTIHVPYVDEIRKVRVVAFYENYVLCHNGFGFETTIDYYDLWIRLQNKHQLVKIPDRFRGVIN